MTRPLPPAPTMLHLNSQHLTLRQHVLAWLESLAAAGYSTRTVEGYRERLLPFLTWCEARGVTAAPQVSLAVLEGWQRWLRSYRKADGYLLAVNGQLHRLSAIRMLFRWLLKRHVILYNPAEGLELPKEERRLPSQVLSEGETRAVLASQEVESPVGLRNRAILELMWSTGLRRMEVAGLMLRDVDAGRGVVNVHQGKGHKDRVVPVGDAALGWLQRYVEGVRPRMAARYDSGHLFLTQRGKGLALSTLTALAGHAIRAQAQLEKAGACHIFRHSMATQMLENGADTRHIQAMLGHEKLETTQVYTRVAIGHLKKVHEQTHPAERKTRRRSRKK